MTTTATLAKIEDHEGDGTCSACGREGLRWIATIVDTPTGTIAVGVECAKTVLGFRPAPSSYAWTAEFSPIAERVEYGETSILWQHRAGTATRETRNGRLVVVGGARSQWIRRGWIAE